MKTIDTYAYIGYAQLMKEITMMAVPGTLSDIIDNTGYPNRMYYVFDAVLDYKTEMF